MPAFEKNCVQVWAADVLKKTTSEAGEKQAMVCNPDVL